MPFERGKEVKNLPVNAADVRNVGSISGSRRSPGGGYGNPPQYSCLENPMDRGAWWATVHSITKSGTQQKQRSTHIYIGEFGKYFRVKHAIALGTNTSG